MKNLIIKTIGSYINLLSFISTEYAAEKALNLFATPRKGKLNEHDDEYLSKAYQEGIDYDEYEIMTYRWPGEGKTILLVHGWESNSARWKFLINQLIASDYNIIALDAPAHGKSSGKQFNAILYSEFINVVANKFDPEIIIGHSVGGMATVFFQSKYQNKSLKKLITLGSPSEFVGVLDRYSELMSYNNRVKGAIDRYIEKKFQYPPSHFSGSKFSKEITSEVLVIHDTEDEVIPYEDALLYEKNYPKASLVSTKGNGHGLKQKEVTNHMLDFINA
ncbi:alpha/beta fold hydrolase [Winogradskyella sp. 3972H.M.0a.05]|uniref:alpha/beta fold hydrolase n=1 Tax=Winogradskyella sp. 3972H.M.0a.05 TaxID=2950277 RepID=UPI00339B73CF